MQTRHHAPGCLRDVTLAGMLAVAAACTGWIVLPAYATDTDGPWGANYFPNVQLVTQDGRTVRFFDDLIKGKVVAINFIYTGCSASCPMETARLREVQNILGERMGRDVFFYSITIDPDNDTPEALKHYATKFSVGPGWLFLTGQNADITLLRQKLGLYMPAIQNGVKDHNLSLIIGNQSTGRWMKSSPFENPQLLATQLGSWLHNWKQANVRKNDYADAPTNLRPLSRGEELFRTRCASCHTVGAANAHSTISPIGPDLTGVTGRRDRAWLTRWLKEPDRMLAEKDPLAMALYTQYNNVAMPNLRLNNTDIAALLTWLDEVGSPSAPSAKPIASQSP